MIPIAHIVNWRQQAPWPDDSQVEQDLILSRALLAIYSNELLCEQLAFRGGTAIHKVFLKPQSRYSEDIDLVQINAGPIGPVMTEIHSALDPWLGVPSSKQNHGRVAFFYHFMTEHEPHVRMRLKVEINTREHFNVLGLSAQPFSVSSPWFAGNAMLTCFHLDELLATKLRALFQRKKGRDLFDLVVALDSGRVDPDRVLDCFSRYLAFEGSAVSRAQFEANLILKAEDPAFLADVAPLLALGTIWDFQAGVQTVLSTLASRMPGAGWKGPGSEPSSKS